MPRDRSIVATATKEKPKLIDASSSNAGTTKSPPGSKQAAAVKRNAAARKENDSVAQTSCPICLDVIVDTTSDHMGAGTGPAGTAAAGPMLRPRL